MRGAKLAIAIGGNFVLGALMTLGIGLYAPCMILVSLLGMSETDRLPDHDGLVRVPDAGGQPALHPRAELQPAQRARPGDRRRLRLLRRRPSSSRAWTSAPSAGWSSWSSSTPRSRCCSRHGPNGRPRRTSAEGVTRRLAASPACSPGWRSPGCSTPSRPPGRRCRPASPRGCAAERRVAARRLGERHRRHGDSHRRRRRDLGPFDRFPAPTTLDFRDIDAVDERTAYVLSIGDGDASRIYKTTDGGRTWTLQFRNTDNRRPSSTRWRSATRDTASRSATASTAGW